MCAPLPPHQPHACQCCPRCRRHRHRRRRRHRHRPCPRAPPPPPPPPLPPPTRCPTPTLSDDGNQFCRLAREALTELDLPYTLVSVGKESPRRADLAALSGRSTAPYLVDANTGEAMGESADICAYLYREYSA